MSDHKTFTTAYAIDKGTWDHISDDTGFREHIENHLGHRLAERIFQECQNGEKIVTIGKPYTHELKPLYQIEVRADVSVQELVRCKDCKYGRPYKHTKEYVACEVDVEPVDRDKDFFCAAGEKREKI